MTERTGGHWFVWARRLGRLLEQPHDSLFWIYIYNEALLFRSRLQVALRFGSLRFRHDAMLGCLAHGLRRYAWSWPDFLTVSLASASNVISRCAPCFNNTFCPSRSGNVFSIRISRIDRPPAECLSRQRLHGNCKHPWLSSEHCPTPSSRTSSVAAC